MLGAYKRSGSLPQVESGDSLAGLLSQARPGDYLALMAYLRQRPEVDRALEDLRRKVMQRYRLATTLGYGPRFLHSTGQIHKGGPATGLFLQLTTDHMQDIPIPGEGYTFGVLAEAQAMGDLQALKSLGRRVIRAHLGPDIEGAIQGLAREVA